MITERNGPAVVVRGSRCIYAISVKPVATEESNWCITHYYCLSIKYWCYKFCHEHFYCCLPTQIPKVLLSSVCWHTHAAARMRLKNCFMLSVIGIGICICNTVFRWQYLRGATLALIQGLLLPRRPGMLRAWVLAEGGKTWQKVGWVDIIMGEWENDGHKH